MKGAYDGINHNDVKETMKDRIIFENETDNTEIDFNNLAGRKRINLLSDPKYIQAIDLQMLWDLVVNAHDQYLVNVGSTIFRGRQGVV